MFPDGPAAAEGTLGQTPFAHLVAYALDKRITGEIYLCEPEKEAGKDGPVHIIRFEAGVPTKIRVGDEFARLGELLLERKVITQATLDGALATHGGLLGDVLVLSGYAESKVIDEALADQFKRRMCRFYALPPETQFKYFDKSTTLVNWGGDPSAVDPFSLLWAGVEAHGEKSSLMNNTLDLLKGGQIKLHPRAPYQRFAFSADATDVVELIALDPTLYEELLELGSVPEETVRKVLYTLVIMRQLDLGKPTLPVGVEERPASVAKVALRSQVHRIGAAAPDAPGDGERTPVRPISIRKGTSGKFEVLPREEDPSSTAVAPESTGPISSPASSPASSPGGPSSPRVPAAEVSRPGNGADAAKAPPAAARPPAPPSKPQAAPPPPKVDGKPPVPKPATASAPTKPDAAKVATQTASKANASVGGGKPLDDSQDSQDSQRRIIAEAVRGMPTKDVIALAIERIEEKELLGALEICRIAREADPESEEVRSTAIWARSLQPGADLKVFSIELDEALRDNDKLVVTRFVRALLRKRLGEDSGALADLKRVLEIDPKHERAQKELAALEKRGGKPADGQKSDPGLLKRLFRR